MSAYGVGMRQMEPHGDKRRDLPRVSSPSAAWRLSGGLRRGGFVYVHATGIRAYIHVDDAGDVDVVGWDAAGERHFPEREALEVVVEHDLRRLRESGRAEDRALLLVAGFDEFRTMRSYAAGRNGTRRNSNAF